MKYRLFLLGFLVVTYSFGATDKEIHATLKKCVVAAADDALDQMFKYLKRVPPKEEAKTNCSALTNDGINCTREYQGDNAAEATFGIRVRDNKSAFFLNFSDESDTPPDPEGPFGYRIRLEAKEIPALTFKKVKNGDIDDLGEESNVSFSYEDIKVTPGAEKSEFYTSYGGNQRTQLVFPSKKHEQCLKER